MTAVSVVTVPKDTKNRRKSDHFLQLVLEVRLLGKAAFS